MNVWSSVAMVLSLCFSLRNTLKIVPNDEDWICPEVFFENGYLQSPLFLTLIYRHFWAKSFWLSKKNHDFNLKKRQMHVKNFNLFLISENKLQFI